MHLLHFGSNSFCSLLAAIFYGNDKEMYHDPTENPPHATVSQPIWTSALDHSAILPFLTFITKAGFIK